MPDKCPCETLWIYNPVELFKSTLTTLDVCESNNINAFSRATLLGLLLAAALGPFVGIVGFIVVLVFLLFLYKDWLYAKVIPEQRMIVRGVPVQSKEGFTSGDVQAIGSSVLTDKNSPNMNVIGNLSSPGVVTNPTAANPFMNVLLDEITYNPTRPAANFASDPNNQSILDDFFRVQWTSDPTDVFGKSQSQREFYTMPSTSIPNDQESYQNWLYLIPGKTCKEGGRDACYPGTNGGAVPWLSQPN
jgi:hypothetical protein